MKQWPMVKQKKCRRSDRFVIAMHAPRVYFNTQVNFGTPGNFEILPRQPFYQGSHFRSPWSARPLKQQKMYPHHQKSKQPGLEKVCLIKSAFFLRPQPWPAGLCLGFASAGLWASAKASEKHFLSRTFLSLVFWFQWYGTFILFIVLKEQNFLF